jgi:hypothetical protein
VVDDELVPGCIEGFVGGSGEGRARAGDLRDPVVVAVGGVAECGHGLAFGIRAGDVEFRNVSDRKTLGTVVE